MRRPIDRPVEVTGDTATHARYGVKNANDYALPNGAHWIAPINGYAYPYTSDTGGYSTRFVVDGATIYLQHGTYAGRPSGWITEGNILGTVGRSGTAWLGYHLHVWVEPDTGGRLSFEEWLGKLGYRQVYLYDIAPTTVTSTAGGGGKPIPLEKRKKDMSTLYVKASTGDKKGGLNSIWALAGDAGTPCAANWYEFTRNPADGGTNDKGKRMTDGKGLGIFLTDAEWDSLKKSYTTPVPITLSAETIQALKA